jgi:hypothetical protein
MRDDQKRALLSDGGKGEAVYQYKVRDLSGWHDCDAGAYERITTNMPEHVEARTLFTAPQAIGKGEAQNVMNIPLDAAATVADYAPQAECAPREAQPVDLLVCSETIRTAILRGNAHAAGLAAGLASLAKEKGFPNYAAPTPERADAMRYRFLRAGASFTAEQSATLRFQRFVGVEHDFHSDWVGERFDASVDAAIDAAILAANKEPQP